MTKNPKRQKLFDEWAKTYDQDLGEGESFPFIGYEDVLDLLVETADMKASQIVLDLGIGTGNLAKRFPIPDRQIWGVDFSETMLDKARNELPQAHLIQADLAEHDWLLDLRGPFDRILSAYTFHEFPNEFKMALLLNLARGCLGSRGSIVIGDISFEDKTQFEWAHKRFANLWDEEEYYWCAQDMTAALSEVGFIVEYKQVSVCAGVYRMQLIDN